MDSFTGRVEWPTVQTLMRRFSISPFDVGRTFIFWSGPHWNNATSPHFDEEAIERCQPGFEACASLSAFWASDSKNCPFKGI